MADASLSRSSDTRVQETCILALGGETGIAVEIRIGFEGLGDRVGTRGAGKVAHLESGESGKLGVVVADISPGM